MNKQILVVGGVGVDTIVKVKQFPIEYRDALGVPPIYDYVSHPGNGISKGLMSLGEDIKFIDFIGEDIQGEMILNHYQQIGLDFSHLIQDTGTRRGINLVDKKGSRMSFYDGRYSESLRMPKDFYLPFYKQASLIHFSIMNWARYMIDEAREMRITVSTDIHDWDGKNEYHKDFAMKSDIVFFSAAGTNDEFKDLMYRIINEGNAKIVVATRGKAGSYLLEKESDTIIHLPIYNIEGTVVDTNGAGDSYISAFLHGYLNGKSLEECMKYGTISGANNCIHEGAHEHFIDQTILSKHLKIFEAQLIK